MKIEKYLAICSLWGFVLLTSIIYYFLMSIMQDLSASFEMVLWAEKHHKALAIISETAMFSAIFLLVSSYLLLTNITCRVVKILSKSFVRILAIALVLTSLFSGRLVYQVYHLTLSDEMVKLVSSSMVASLHLASIMLSALILLISFSLVKKAKLVFALGIVAALSQCVIAYPWLLPFESVFSIILVLLGWFMLLTRFISRCQGLK